MHGMLWRIASILAAVGGVAFGLLAGAAIVRTDLFVVPAAPDSGDSVIEMNHVPVGASPSGPPRTEACAPPGQASAPSERQANACEKAPDK